MTLVEIELILSEIFVNAKEQSRMIFLLFLVDTNMVVCLNGKSNLKNALNMIYSCQNANRLTLSLFLFKLEHNVATVCVFATFAGDVALILAQWYCGIQNLLNALRRGNKHTGVLWLSAFLSFQIGL
jgi:hypothetical protein